MADFNTIVKDVITITNRPDLVSETQLAVKSATLQLHRSEYFSKDIYETAIQFDTSAYLQTINYRTLFPRYRSLKYLRKYDPLQGSNGVGSFIEVITPTEVLDTYSCPRNNVCYVAGDLIQVRADTAIQYALIGIYQNPDVTPETYKSWISDEAYYSIVYKAASIVFGTVLGDTGRQQANDSMAMMEMLEVKNSNIIDIGY